jgi:hypothetical protein
MKNTVQIKHKIPINTCISWGLSYWQPNLYSTTNDYTWSGHVRSSRVYICCV